MATDQTITVQEGKWIKVQARTGGTPKQQETISLAPGDTVTVKRAGGTPPPPADERLVNPGENIEFLLSTEDQLRLLPGQHQFFAVPADGQPRSMTRDTGAVVRGGVMIGAGANASLMAPVVTDSVFAIIARGAFNIVGCDLYGNSEGIRIEGAAAKGAVTGGKIHDNSKVVRNTQSPGGDDYSAQGIGFRNTDGPILIDGVSIYNQRVFGPMPTSSWDDDGWTLGIKVRPQTQSWDYRLNDGSAFKFWQARGIEIRNGNYWNNMCVLETGTHGPDCTFSFHHNLIRNLNSDPAQLSQGMLLRAARNSLIEHNTIVNPDHWAMTIEGGGGFGSTVDGLRVRSNLVVTPSALFETNGQAAGNWTHDHNGVAGSKDWGAFGAEPTGIAATDPLFTADFHLQPGSPFSGKAHDGGNIGAF